MRLVRLVVPVLLAAVLAVPAAAQGDVASSFAGTPARGARGGRSLSLTPYVGLHVPMMDLMKQSLSGDAGAGTTQLKQQVSITFGGRLGIWPSERVGIETDVGYTPGNLTFTSNGVATDRTSRVLTGSAKLVVRVLPARSFFNLTLSGGMGAVNHRADAVDGTASTGPAQNVTDLGGVLGASARLRLGRILSLSAGADDYLYHATIDKVAGTKSERLQHDMRYSFGLGLPFFGM
jgi:hypothetical protein